MPALHEVAESTLASLEHQRVQQYLSALTAARQAVIARIRGSSSGSPSICATNISELQSTGHLLQSMSESYVTAMNSPPHTANVVGALALALSDRMTEAMAADVPETDATALSALHHILGGSSIDRLRQVVGAYPLGSGPSG